MALDWLKTNRLLARFRYAEVSFRRESPYVRELPLYIDEILFELLKTDHTASKWALEKFDEITRRPMSDLMADSLAENSLQNTFVLPGRANGAKIILARNHPTWRMAYSALHDPYFAEGIVQSGQVARYQVFVEQHLVRHGLPHEIEFAMWTLVRALHGQGVRWGQAIRDRAAREAEDLASGRLRYRNNREGSFLALGFLLGISQKLRDDARQEITENMEHYDNGFLFRILWGLSLSEARDFIDRMASIREHREVLVDVFGYGTADGYFETALSGEGQVPLLRRSFASADDYENLLLFIQAIRTKSTGAVALAPLAARADMRFDKRRRVQEDLVKDEALECLAVLTHGVSVPREVLARLLSRGIAKNWAIAELGRQHRAEVTREGVGR